MRRQGCSCWVVAGLRTAKPDLVPSLRTPLQANPCRRSQQWGPAAIGFGMLLAGSTGPREMEVHRYVETGVARKETPVTVYQTPNRGGVQR